MNRLVRLSAVLCFLSACTARIVAGGSGGGASTTGGTGGDSDMCSAPSPGMCSPSPCVDGHQRTGQAACQDGTWSCVEVECSPGTCAGSGYTVCEGAKITVKCCPPGAFCDPGSFCDLGGGACTVGPCVAEAGAPCTSSIDSSKYDQTCSSDADCAAVYAGPLCGNCFCPNAAINQSQLPAYDADFAAGNPGVNVCNCPLLPNPVCSSGVCTLP